MGGLRKLSGRSWHRARGWKAKAVGVELPSPPKPEELDFPVLLLRPIITPLAECLTDATRHSSVVAPDGLAKDCLMEHRSHGSQHTVRGRCLTEFPKHSRGGGLLAYPPEYGRCWSRPPDDPSWLRYSTRQFLEGGHSAVTCGEWEDPA